MLVSSLRTLMNEIFTNQTSVRASVRLSCRMSTAALTHTTSSTDGSGIHPRRSTNMASRLSVYRRNDAIDLVCEHFDPNHDGFIHVQDFLRAFRIAENSIQHQSLESRRLYAGTMEFECLVLPLQTLCLIVAEEYERAVMNMGTPERLTDEDIDKLMTWIDESGDGMIDYGELEAAFRKARYAHPVS